MSFPTVKELSVPKHLSRTLPRELFSALATDLGLSSEPSVQQALVFLEDEKYIEFLAVADSWCRQQYDTFAEHFAWNQLGCLLSKYPFSGSSDLVNAALKKFYASEHKCRRMNDKFRSLKKRDLHTIRLGDRVNVARSWILRVLGAKPNLTSIYNSCDFGPGASIGVHGDITNKGRKLTDRFSVSPSAAHNAFAALSTNWHIWEHLLGEPVCVDIEAFYAKCRESSKYVSHNLITTVPKNAKTNRTIAIEPTLNSYLQKGIDTELRRKLLEAGIDLSDQTKNRLYAEIGSNGGVNPFSTIDLSAASDSISIELARLLLPAAWFDLLNATRSHQYVVGDCAPRYYQKFCSMGNGFCFPLETLIFASAVHSAYAVTGDRDFAVYGDDIIVRQNSALLTLEILSVLGFKANQDKTFLFGPFRESCGADFFDGHDVRPYFLKKPIVNYDDIFKVLNFISRRGRNLPLTWDYLFSIIPENMRLLRPYHRDTDGAITVSLEAFMSSPCGKWSPALQRWMWAEVKRVAVEDSTRYTTGVQMYVLLSGALSSRAGSPVMTKRLRTRTAIKVRPW